MLTLPDFVARWRNTKLGERAAAQSHFIDLCEALEQPRPAAVDQKGESYTFEKRIEKAGGGKGFADVWCRGHFAWEYKGLHKDLRAAYGQLVQYQDDLENPPLLVVCDFETFEVHTKFTNTPTRTFRFTLQDLADNKPTAQCAIRPVEVLRALFVEPRRLRSDRSPEQVTKEAAIKFAGLSDSLKDRNVPPDQAAHFIMRMLFCMFAEAIGLLPERIFSQLLLQTQNRPKEFSKRLKLLFLAMSGEGGSFGSHDIPYFNGGLFSDDSVVELTSPELAMLVAASSLNWGSIEPAIFGTLFEASLDTSKRSRFGAHYTSLEDILAIIEPVLMKPLREEWVTVKARAWAIADKRRKSQGRALKKLTNELDDLLQGFARKVGDVHILDPACGSGNFLYVALRQLLDLEREISFFAAENGLSGLLPLTDPSRLFGIENDPYAHELASIVVWIGFIQWQCESGLQIHRHPVLKPLDNITLGDAVMTGAGEEPDWPNVDVIISNPPFLGDKKMREMLGDEYVNDLRRLYRDRLPGGSDLVCYWFEKSRAMIAGNKAKRAGLLATQGIRGGRNRAVLDEIGKTGRIFWAESDRDWALEGAAVHVSMVGFDDGSEKTCYLNRQAVQHINSDLTASVDVTRAHTLPENSGIAFIGTQKGGSFDLPMSVATQMLRAPRNPNGRPNSDVVRPWLNASDLTGAPRRKWIIDFGTELEQAEAAMYEQPFEYVEKTIRAKRLRFEGRDSSNSTWWRHQRPRPEMRRALQGKSRFIATPRHSKHRVFSWEPLEVLPDSALVVFARDDDYFFGVLHSRVHEIWTRRNGTQVREAESGFRYTPTTTFETFPFPWEPGAEPEQSPQLKRIGRAARELVEKRDAWLNPSGQSGLELKARTLTALYNAYPSWLRNAHSMLDEAVLASYGWAKTISDDELLSSLLSLNAERYTAVKKLPIRQDAAPKKSAMRAAK